MREKFNTREKIKQEREDQIWDRRSNMREKIKHEREDQTWERSLKVLMTTAYKWWNCQVFRPANCCQHIPPNRFFDGFPDPSQFAAAKLTHYSSKPQRPSDSSRSWQRILLSGDVHPNPGPTSFVNTAIGNMKDNRVLNSRPPSINDEETILQRRQRTTLSQLRSGHCKLLNSYKKRLKQSDSSRCPDCGMDPQDVPHLFDCVAHPNDLSPVNLWTRATWTNRRRWLKRAYNNNNYIRSFLVFKTQQSIDELRTGLAALAIPHPLYRNYNRHQFQHIKHEREV